MIVVPYGYNANENKVGEAQSFSFKPIPVEKKIEAVSKAIAGDKIQPVAREIGVHRTSIHIWRERLWTGFAGSIRISYELIFQRSQYDLFKGGNYEDRRIRRIIQRNT